MGTLLNVEGRLVPPEQAFVPVRDRGFLYGDSVYEVRLAASGLRRLLTEAHRALPAPKRAENSASANDICRVSRVGIEPTTLGLKG